MDAGAPKLVIVSPIAYEDLSDSLDVPGGKTENANSAPCTQSQCRMWSKKKPGAGSVFFVDAFTPSQSWYNASKAPLTIDGSQLNDAGYQKLGALLADQVFGKAAPKAGTNRELVYQAVQEKNWMWLSYYKIPNGVHVYGRRFKPFGPDNYPAEIEKIRQMTIIRDSAVWDSGRARVKK